MKVVIFLFLIMNSTLSLASMELIDYYKKSLPGIYSGDNCELRIHTEWFGEYYKRFLFFKDGKLVDRQTFFVETLIQDLESFSNGKILLKLHDEVGSDGEDKYINLTMNLELRAQGLEVTGFRYQYYSHTFFGIPTDRGHIACSGMKRTGDAQDITLDTNYDY